MFIEAALKYLKQASGRTKIRIGAFVVALQLFIFLLITTIGMPVFSHLSLIPIIGFSIVFGELPGVCFATIVTMCYSPLWMDLSGDSSAFWVLRTFGFAAVAYTTGALSTSVMTYATYREKIYFTDLFTKLPNRQALCEKLLSNSKAQITGILQ